MLHNHALQSLDLLIVWCQIRGVLRLALLRKIFLLNESIGTHIEHLVKHLILYLFIDLAIGDPWLLVAQILSEHSLLLQLKILLLLNDGVRESLIQIRSWLID